MKHLRILAFAATAMLASSTWASAQEAFTTSDVNMRAGPGSRYPVVTTIPADREVFIHGCLSNWDWCDVSWRRNRGWVFSDYLEALYRSRRIGFDEYRTFIDIPFVSFSFGYWDRHYRNRPWFDDWDRWDDRRDRPRSRDRDRDRDWDQDRDRIGIRMTIAAPTTRIGIATGWVSARTMTGTARTAGNGGSNCPRTIARACAAAHPTPIRPALTIPGAVACRWNRTDTSRHGRRRPSAAVSFYLRAGVSPSKP
jgi:uncharacterized protein YraI